LERWCRNRRVADTERLEQVNLEIPWLSTYPRAALDRATDAR
jgi:hypothetical protein